MILVTPLALWPALTKPSVGYSGHIITLYRPYKDHEICSIIIQKKAIRPGHYGLFSNFHTHVALWP